jgi:hypothetical protein
MDALPQVLTLLDRFDFMTKTDLAQAYYSVPIAEHRQPYLAFSWNDQVWMFTRMCFGLNIAPRIFTKLLKPVVKMIRRLGGKMIAYLDDLWVAHRDWGTCQRLTLHLRETLQELGFTINDRKSTTEPVQRLVLLGMTLCTRSMSVAIPQQKLGKILKLLRDTRAGETISTNSMSSLIGKLEALRPAFEMAPLYLRGIQRWLIQHTRDRPPSGTQLPLPPHLAEELRFWETLLPSIPPRRIIVYQGTITKITTDASLTGWGAMVDGQPIHGVWTPQQQQLHINTLEILAIELALKGFESHLSNKNILLEGDNTTSLSYISKKGGTKSIQMTTIAIRIWEFVMHRQIHLEVAHIPGVDNVQADHLSRLRDMMETTEWTLDPQVFRQLDRTWGPLQRDLFASPQTTQLQEFISWKEPHHMMNAFHHEWKETDYAFPPFALVGKVLNKVKADQCRILLVAPKWEAQSWFPTLISMLYDQPRQLPYSESLLRDLQGNPHPLGQSVRLTAWPVTGNDYDRRDFQRTSLKS